MPQYTELTTEIMQPLHYMIYQVLSPGVHYTPYVSVNLFHRFFANCFIGNMGATAEVVITVYQATDAAGAGAKTTGIYTPQFDEDDGEALSHIAIDIRTEQLDVDGGFDYVALQIDVDDNPVEFTAYLWGAVPRYPPVATTFWANITTA